MFAGEFRMDSTSDICVSSSDPFISTRENNSYLYMIKTEEDCHEKMIVEWKKLVLFSQGVLFEVGEKILIINSLSFSQ
jgi:hypothetical protein